jgi:DNA-binding HxlR family transcriptional regulator
VLAERLRQLKADGMVTRTYVAEVPPRVEYEATALARTLVPVFEPPLKWSDEHLDEVVAARRVYQDL